MSGICGWIAFGRNGVLSPEIIERMGARIGRFGDNLHLERSPTASVAGTLRKPGSMVWRQGEDIVALHGHIRFADPALSNRVRDHGLGPTLLAAFRKGGSEFLQTARGTFALALILGQDRKALLAVDRVSVCPLSFARVQDGIVFGSDSTAINQHPSVSREVDPQQIFNYLYFHMVSSPGSAYKDHERVPPGGYVVLNGTTVTIGTYWEVAYTRESERLSVAELKDEFRHLLRESVRRELDTEQIGSFLSGGTDSSTVAGVIGELTGAPAHTYSIGFDAEGYDETHYAHVAVRHFGTVHREYRVTPQDVADAVPRIAEAHAEPFGNSSAIPTYYCARIAQSEGIVKMLAGDGGDELFGGNVRYATQYLFSLYSDLPAALRKYVIEPVVFSVPGGERVLPLRKLRSYIRQASIPMPARLETYNLLERLGQTNVLSDDFLAAVDTARPLQMLIETYSRARATTQLNRMLALDLKFTLADNDLPKVCRAADLAGIDVGYPLLSDELIDFAARLPTRLKLRGTRLRYFFKEALRDFLPQEIITKKKHGFGLPFGPWLTSNAALKEIAFDALSDVRRRNVVRPDFVDRLLDHYLPTHPGFYGTMVWLLMMLEFWYRHHVDTKP